MALADVLAQIPGRGAYLAQQQYDDQRNQSALAQVLGVANLIETQKQRAMQAQMQQAQLAELQRRSQEEQAGAARMQSLGQLFSQMQQPRTETDAADNVTQSPGLSAEQAMRQIVPKMVFDPNPRVQSAASNLMGRMENIDSRRESAQQQYQLGLQRLQQQREQSMRDAQNQADRIAAQQQYQQGLLALKGAMVDVARMNAGNRQYPIVETSEGIFERRPGGLVRLEDPTSGAPLRPKTSDKPLTEGQGKAIMYGSRAAQSDKVLRSLEENINNLGLRAGQMLPMGTALMSADQQRVDQAQRDFINAILRQESGAVISDAEFGNARKQYFPQPGDDKKTIEQKRMNRKIAIDGFRRMAGPGASDIDAIREAPLLPASPSPDIDALVRKYGG